VGAVAEMVVASEQQLHRLQTYHQVANPIQPRRASNQMFFIVVCILFLIKNCRQKTLIYLNCHFKTFNFLIFLFI
jgi:hypothetical protein